MRKKAQIILAAAFITASFVSIDLGLNFARSLVPELNDGIAVHSVLHGIFRIFGDRGWSRERFFRAFEGSLWVLFVIVCLNLCFYLFWRKQTEQK